MTPTHTHKESEEREREHPVRNLVILALNTCRFWIKVIKNENATILQMSSRCGGSDRLNSRAHFNPGATWSRRQTTLLFLHTPVMIQNRQEGDRGNFTAQDY